MFTINIDNSYKITGSNDAQAYCLSTDTKDTTDKRLKNGFKLIEMDTSTIYFFDEANKVWLPFT